MENGKNDLEIFFLLTSLFSLYHFLSLCVCKGEYEKVIDQCNLAIDLQKGSAKAHLRRGLACEKLEKYDLAQSDFKTVIELDPTNHIASSGLVRCAKVRQLASKSAF